MHFAECRRIWIKSALAPKRSAVRPAKRRELKITASIHLPVRGYRADGLRPYGGAGIPNRDNFFRAFRFNL